MGAQSAGVPLQVLLCLCTSREFGDGINVMDALVHCERHGIHAANLLVYLASPSQIPHSLRGIYAVALETSHSDFGRCLIALRPSEQQLVTYRLAAVCLNLCEFDDCVHRTSAACFAGLWLCMKLKACYGGNVSMDMAPLRRA